MFEILFNYKNFNKILNFYQNIKKNETLNIAII